MKTCGPTIAGTFTDWMWCYTSVILTLGQQRQEDLRTPKFWTSLAYTSDCRPARTTCEVVLKQSKHRKIQIYFTRLR